MKDIQGFQGQGWRRDIRKAGAGAETQGLVVGAACLLAGEESCDYWPLWMTQSSGVRGSRGHSLPPSSSPLLLLPNSLPFTVVRLETHVC